MGKNVIVSEETIRDLLEAHASLSAWYYELSSALRAVGAVCGAPEDAKRAAFVERMAIDFPEIGQVVRTIKVPRMYVPPPPAVGQVVANAAVEGAPPPEPPPEPPPPAAPPLPPMPALVDASKLKF
jgi:hypothetical protein